MNSERLFFTARLHFGDQAHGVVRGVHLDVVVEVDVNVAPLGAARWWCRELGALRLAAVAPRANALGPTLEGRVGVAAFVELRVAVQTNVDEVARQVFEEWPAAGRVGDDERDVLFAQ